MKAAARGSGAAQYTVEYELLKTIHVVGAAQLRPSWCWSHGAWSSWDFGRELPRHGSHAWEVRRTSRRPTRPPRGAGPAHHAPRGTGVRPAQPATWRRDVGSATWQCARRRSGRHVHAPLTPVRRISARSPPIRPGAREATRAVVAGARAARRAQQEQPDEGGAARRSQSTSDRRDPVARAERREGRAQVPQGGERAGARLRIARLRARALARPGASVVVVVLSLDLAPRLHVLLLLRSGGGVGGGDAPLPRLCRRTASCSSPTPPTVSSTRPRASPTCSTRPASGRARCAYRSRALLAPK